MLFVKWKKKPYSFARFYAKIRRSTVQRLAALFFADIKDGFLITA